MAWDDAFIGLQVVQEARAAPRHDSFESHECCSNEAYSQQWRRQQQHMCLYIEGCREALACKYSHWCMCALWFSSAVILYTHAGCTLQSHQRLDLYHAGTVNDPLMCCGCRQHMRRRMFTTAEAAAELLPRLQPSCTPTITVARGAYRHAWVCCAKRCCSFYRWCLKQQGQSSQAGQKEFLEECHTSYGWPLRRFSVWKQSDVVLFTVLRNRL
jgi:hypothetical protein